MKKLGAFIFILFVTGLAGIVPCRDVQAASAAVEFSTQNQEVETGSEFTVVCQVSSTTAFTDVEMNVIYDAGVMEFIKGGKKVTGGNGVLHISSTGNTEAVNKRTYSLQFRALKGGSSSVKLDSSVAVSDADGGTYSVSSNRIVVTVHDEAKQPLQGEEQGAASTATPEPAVPLSTNNKLKTLRFHCISMTPEFDSEVLEYTVKVDCNTNILYLNYIAASSKAIVRIRNNEELIVGENDVRIVVQAQSGDKRVYKLNVIKESESETRVREQQEKGSSDITFSVYEKDGSIFIQNQYQFEVTDAPDEGVIPSGYVKTTVEIDGKNVPAHTMENDLDNNYLLMYLKGVGKEATLYQYDRAEKTIQRYTGTMVQKVNQGGTVAQQAESIPGAWLYGIIVVLMVLVLALLIVILNMVLKKKIGKGKKELDDLDF